MGSEIFFANACGHVQADTIALLLQRKIVNGLWKGLDGTFVHLFSHEMFQKVLCLKQVKKKQNKGGAAI